MPPVLMLYIITCSVYKASQQNICLAHTSLDINPVQILVNRRIHDKNILTIAAMEIYLLCWMLRQIKSTLLTGTTLCLVLPENSATNPTKP